ncbi:hypothetical protein JCM19236_4253 [Vibrio sp. JCM 19236]|nr:hypothetical protein JCM19236_4253 [Vibrio sp. JCM 19236]
MSDLISFADDYQGESGYFWEGAILASNLTVKPLEPENWAADLFGEGFEQAKPTIVEHINGQFAKLKANQYSA